MDFENIFLPIIGTLLTLALQLPFEVKKVEMYKVIDSRTETTRSWKLVVLTGALTVIQILLALFVVVRVGPFFTTLLTIIAGVNAVLQIVKMAWHVSTFSFIWPFFVDIPQFYFSGWLCLLGFVLLSSA